MIVKEFINLLRTRFSSGAIAELSWVLAGQSVTVILSFIIIKIISGLGSDIFGIYALVLTIAAFLGLLFGSVQQGFLRFYYHFLNLDSGYVFVKLFFRFIGKSTLLFLLLFSVCAILLSSVFNSYSFLFLMFAGFFIVFSKLSEFFNSLLNLIRRRKENSILQTLEKTSLISALLVFIHFNRLNLLNIFIAFSLIAFSFFILKYFFFNKFVSAVNEQSEENNEKVEKEIKVKVYYYVLPFFIWSVAGWLQMNGEKWIINGYLSVSDVGVYAIMIAIVNALIVLPNNIFSEFITPIIFKQFSDLSKKDNMNAGYFYIKLNVAAVSIVSFVSVILTFSFGKQLILLISNAEYITHYTMLPFLAIGIGMFYVGQAYTLLGLSLNKPKIYLLPKISSGILSIILNILLISNFGLIGVVYSTCIIGIFYLIYIIAVNNSLKKQFN